jgi:hypothetical protein
MESFRVDSESMTQTVMVAVLLAVIQLGGKSVPDTVKVHCDLANLVRGDQQGSEIIVLTNVRLCIYVNLATGPLVGCPNSLCSIWVSAADNPNDILCMPRTIR